MSRQTFLTQIAESDFAVPACWWSCSIRRFGMIRQGCLNSVFRCGRDTSGDLLRRLSFPNIWRFRCKRIKVFGRGISELGHGAETNIDLVKFAQDRLNGVERDCFWSCFSACQIARIKMSPDLYRAGHYFDAMPAHECAGTLSRSEKRNECAGWRGTCFHRRAIRV
jgi:hypothetical protein